MAMASGRGFGTTDNGRLQLELALPCRASGARCAADNAGMALAGLLIRSRCKLRGPPGRHLALGSAPVVGWGRLWHSPLASVWPAAVLELICMASRSITAVQTPPKPGARRLGAKKKKTKKAGRKGLEEEKPARIPVV